MRKSAKEIREQSEWWKNLSGEQKAAWLAALDRPAWQRDLEGRLGNDWRRPWIVGAARLYVRFPWLGRTGILTAVLRLVGSARRLLGRR